MPWVGPLPSTLSRHRSWNHRSRSAAIIHRGHPVAVGFDLGEGERTDSPEPFNGRRAVRHERGPA